MKSNIVLLILSVVMGIGLASTLVHASAATPARGAADVRLSASSETEQPISHSGVILAIYKWNPGQRGGMTTKPCSGKNCPAPTCYQDGNHQVCLGNPNKQPIIPGDCVGPQCGPL